MFIELLSNLLREISLNCLKFLQHQLSHLDLATDVNLDDFQVVLNELDKTLQKPLSGCTKEHSEGGKASSNPVVAGPYRCKQCPRTFPYASSLAYHTEVSHLKDMFDCTFCGKVFSR